MSLSDAAELIQMLISVKVELQQVKLSNKTMHKNLKAVAY